MAITSTTSNHEDAAMAAILEQDDDAAGADLLLPEKQSVHPISSKVAELLLNLLVLAAPRRSSSSLGFSRRAGFHPSPSPSLLKLGLFMAAMVAGGHVYQVFEASSSVQGAFPDVQLARRSVLMEGGHQRLSQDQAEGQMAGPRMLTRWPDSNRPSGVGLHQAVARTPSLRVHQRLTGFDRPRGAGPFLSSSPAAFGVSHLLPSPRASTAVHRRYSSVYGEPVTGVGAGIGLASFASKDAPWGSAVGPISCCALTMLGSSSCEVGPSSCAVGPCRTLPSGGRQAPDAAINQATPPCSIKQGPPSDPWGPLHQCGGYVTQINKEPTSSLMSTPRGPRQGLSIKLRLVPLVLLFPVPIGQLLLRGWFGDSAPPGFSVRASSTFDDDINNILRLSEYYFFNNSSGPLLTVASRGQSIWVHASLAPLRIPLAGRIVFPYASIEAAVSFFDLRTLM